MTTDGEEAGYLSRKVDARLREWQLLGKLKYDPDDVIELVNWDNVLMFAYGCYDEVITYIDKKMKETDK